MGKNEQIARTAQNVWAYIAAFLRWSVLGLIVGGCGGLVGAAFSKAVAYATTLRGENGWLLWLLPAGGLVIVGLYKLCHVSGVGTNEVFEGVRAEKGVSVWLAPAIFLGTVITHLFGGSAGREGAALQLGGSVATLFGRVFRLNERDRHILTMCGMSAVFAAVFGTPMAACVFAVEVVSVGRFCTAALFPCIVSSASAYGVAQLLGVAPERFLVENAPGLELGALWRVIVVAIVCAVVSMLFCWAMHMGAKLFKRFFKNEFLRVAVGGAVIIVLSLLVGTTDYNGGGMDVIERVFEEGTVRPEAFLLKILFTAITIGAGFKGGEIVPTLFIGATLGGAVSLLIGLNPAFGAAVGMAALFCGVTNCPMTTVLLSIELFGAGGALFYMLAAFISFLFSGYFSLYSGQHIVFSKLHEEEVNVRGH
ncbi:MAG: chloride channel protein [Hominenteromicrobium sp.]